jgi:hypothetical protein
MSFCSIVEARHKVLATVVARCNLTYPKDSRSYSFQIQAHFKSACARTYKIVSLSRVVGCPKATEVLLEKKLKILYKVKKKNSQLNLQPIINTCTPVVLATSHLHHVYVHMHERPTAAPKMIRFSETVGCIPA